MWHVVDVVQRLALINDIQSTKRANEREKSDKGQRKQSDNLEKMI